MVSESAQEPITDYFDYLSCLESSNSDVLQNQYPVLHRFLQNPYTEATHFGDGMSLHQFYSDGELFYGMGFRYPHYSYREEGWEEFERRISPPDTRWRPKRYCCI